MAAADVVIAAPPVPVPVPVPAVRRISRRALAAADAAVCLWFVSMWVLLASIAAVLIRLLACGWGCTGAAWMAVLVSLLFAASCGVLTEFKETFQYYIDILEKGAAALEPISEAVVNAHIIATAASATLEFFGFLLKLLAANDPPAARVASVIMVSGAIGSLLHVLPRFNSGFGSQGVEDETIRPHICGSGTHLK